MSVAQLLSSGIESIINQLLKLDPESLLKLKKLQDKSLQVRVRELPWPLLFQFSEKVSVGIVQPDEKNLCSCSIELNLETLPLLQDSSQLSQLIQQQKLILNGDIYVAQSFSHLIKELDIDWEEQLSNYTGDVVAYQTFSSVGAVIKKAKAQWLKGEVVWAERLTKEGAIGINQQQLDLYSEQVNDLRNATDRLGARLKNLEKIHKATL